MRENLINLLLVIGLVGLITACVSERGSVKTGIDSAGPIAGNETVSDPAGTDRGKSADIGDFIVEHSEVKNAKFLKIDNEIKRERLLEDAADRLNTALILPDDIFLRTKDCGDINAFYNSEERSITVCYELMDHFYQVFRDGGNDESGSFSKMFDAVRFVFLHEIAHGLIDAYDLPITGNEEDAADRCSAFINLNELGDDGVRAVFAASDAFEIESRQGGKRSKSLADEHLLQEQRFYNSLCMIYGSNSNKHSNIVTDGYLPKERADRCPVEYQRTVDSWTSLLEPWRKKYQTGF
ncbi:MAG: DUF4344 domain-containing metallopeptidase [Pyrinomonadaceae bacterium]